MSAAHFTVRRFVALTLAIATVAVAASPSRAGFDSFIFAGSTLSSSLDPTINAFRTAIGGANNANTLAAVGSGRREINWDGGGAATAAVTAVPTLSAFTNIRGATMTTPGTGFLQTPLGDVALTGIQASYATTFNVFSVQRIFTPTGSNITDVKFSIAGTNGATPATVSAFGAVFTDVDLANTTTIEFFNLSDALLLLLNVPPGVPGATAPNGTFSFAGAEANAGEQIARVRITTGNQALGQPDSNGNPVDVVVMDDFIYAEPIAVPEPASAALAAAAAIVLASVRRRRQS